MIRAYVGRMSSKVSSIAKKPKFNGYFLNEKRAKHESELRQKSASKLLHDIIETGEAPIVAHATEAEQKSLDATVKKLLRFLSN